ncbi:LOW QUALITY PROTEIN: FDF domain-containing protein, partial [Cephalotus follicularis]
HSLPSHSSLVSSSSVQNQIQHYQCQDSPIMRLKNSSESFTSTPSTVAPVHSSVSPIVPSLSIKASLPTHAVYMADNRLTMSISLNMQDTNNTEAQIVGKVVIDPMLVHSTHSMPNSVPAFADSTSGPMLTPLPSLLTPDQLPQSRSPVLSSSQKMYPDQKDIGTMIAISCRISTPVIQSPCAEEPSMTLHFSCTKSQYSNPKFTEEFDFIAMNEMLEKDEAWGYLGKAKQRDVTEGEEDISTDQSLGNKGGDGQLTNINTKPAYKKDEFFDTITCNSLSRGSRNGHHCFYE